MKAAFFRDGYLWTKIDNKEEKRTKEQAKHPYPPKWSYDGKWILYQKEVPSMNDPSQETQLEIWVYHIETNQHIKVFYDGWNPQWSPTENIVAFQSRDVLNISNLKEFKNVALGVSSYQWYPDGHGFIASSSATLRPDGWTNPVLYNIPLEKDFQKVNLTQYKPLFIIPKELSNGNESILSINATNFAFSPDGKWISFIVSPTASLSMDNDMVCVLTSDGKNFSVLDETILHIGTPEWAPSKNSLAYIAGSGRIVFGFKNKNLKVTELPAFQSIRLTPDKYADMWFTWLDNHSLIASRVPEKEWSNDPIQRPNPALYLIMMNKEKQTKITSPKKGKGDYQPLFNAYSGKLTWVRRSLTEIVGDLWIADPDGRNAEIWIKDIEEYSTYEGKEH